MATQSFVAPVQAGGASSSHTAIASTTTRTNLWDPALWTPIPAFTLRTGQLFRLVAAGRVSDTGTPTVIVNPTFGQSSTPASNAALGASITLTLPTGLTNVPWHAWFDLYVYTIGAAASGSSIRGQGAMVIGGPAGTASTMLAFGGTNVTTADHSTAQGLCLDWTWGTSSASNTVQCNWVHLEY